MEDKGRKKEKGKKVHKISIEAKEGNESEANKIDWTRSGVGQREGSHGVSRAWEKASRFIDCKALELPPEALLLHHPHCSIKFSSTEELTHGPRWSYVALSPSWLFPRFLVDDRRISLSRSGQLNATFPLIRREIRPAIFAQGIANCRHALRCILGGLYYLLVSVVGQLQWRNSWNNLDNLDNNYHTSFQTIITSKMDILILIQIYHYDYWKIRLI